jgi:hypothetical protein
MDVVSFASSRAVSLRVGALKHDGHVSPWQEAVGTWEAQQFRAPGLNFVIAAILFWNAIAELREAEQLAPDALLAHTSPLSWEHVSFSGDFLWERAAATADERRSSISARREPLHNTPLTQPVRP